MTRFYLPFRHLHLRHAWPLLSVLVATLALMLVSTSAANAANAASSGEVTAATSSATFDRTDRTGCIFTESTIVARTSSQGMSLELRITQVNQCTATLIISAGGATPAFHFEASPSVCGAQAEAQGVAVFDEVTGNTFLVNIELAWMGTGTIEQFQGNGDIAFARSAVATGQIRIGTTNYASHQSTSGLIEEVQLPGGHVPNTCD